MGKAQKFNQIKRITKTKHSDAVPHAENVPVPDRLQKKIAKRVKFLERVAVNHDSALKATKGRVAKRKHAVPASLADLSTLSASLGDVEGALLAAGASTARKGGGSGAARKQGSRLGAGAGKKRAKILRQETGRLQQVLAHPKFQQDPFAAVAAHLEATMPAAVAPPKAPLKPEEVRAKRREKKKRAKQRAAAADMMAG